MAEAPGKVKADIVVSGAKELLTVSGAGGKWDIGLIKDGTVAGLDGRIVAAGRRDAVDETISLAPGGTWIDAGGKVVMPGFVDCHTHALFSGSREDEFAMRLSGADYMEIRRKGYGIRSSVRSFRASTDDELVTATLGRIGRMAAMGTTTVEIKSGYGLSFDEELRALELIKKIGGTSAVEIVPTFLGAHDVPEEFEGRRESYVDLIVNELIPEVAKRNLAKFCDVFCEDGVFTVEESRRVLTEGLRRGLRPKIHADEFTDSGGAGLAAEVGAVSADHLVHTGSAGIRMMKDSSVIPVLLPACSFSLARGAYAKGREMIEEGLPVALATDLNPGSSMCESMQMVISLACVQVGLTPEEAIVASTRNASLAVGLGDETGALETGKRFDVIVLDIPSYKYIPYHFGGNHVKWAISRGKVAACDGKPA